MSAAAFSTFKEKLNKAPQFTYLIFFPSFYQTNEEMALLQKKSGKVDHLFQQHRLVMMTRTEAHHREKSIGK